ncbi:GNAT family N-acetyltransferase, partial [Streptococcus suis]
NHYQKKKMHHILKKLGYVYCGKVPIDVERLAYQKIKQKSERSLYQEISEYDRWLVGNN